MDNRFLLDEQLRGQLWRAIRWHNQQGAYPLDVVRVADPDDLAQGSTDAEILAWAEREGRILVSGDRKTLLTHFTAHLKASRHSPGLFLLRPFAPLPQIVDFLVAVAYASDPSEWTDVWRYIP